MNEEIVGRERPSDRQDCETAARCWRRSWKVDRVQEEDRGDKQLPEININININIKENN